MAFLLVLLTTLLTAPAAPADVQQFDLYQPAGEPCVLTSFARMLQAADGRMRGSESAAFLTASGGGTLSVQPWPSGSGVWRERFEGVLPDGVVGVVHTHPVAWDRPSRGDVAEAIRIGLPIYVVSQWRIWAVDPASGSVVAIAAGGWRREAERNRCPAVPSRPAIARGDVGAHLVTSVETGRD